MPAALVTTATVLACAHGAPALATPGAARVRSAGAAVLYAGDPVALHACTATPACGAVRLAASTRVTASGRPIAIDGGAIAHGNGLPVLTCSLQERVRAI